MADLDELRALLAAATPGPWHESLGTVYPAGRQPSWQPTPVEGGAIDARWPILAGENANADAALIVWLRNHAEALLADSLDAAWAEAEAALPEGDGLELTLNPLIAPSYFASSGYDTVTGTSPTAALHALAAQLTDER